MMMPATLAEVLDALWHRLERGVRERHDPFHLGVLCTLGTRGPEARTVVLRHADRGRAVLQAHTDLRAPKVAELRAEPRLTWLAFGDQVQIRARGRATVHHDDAIADAAWARSSPSSRRCYLADTAPSTELEQLRNTLPEALQTRRPEVEETLPGRAQFAVIRIELGEIDWLHLDSNGHRRALFRASGGRWSGRWLAP